MYYDAGKLEYGLEIAKRFFPNGKLDTFDHNKIRQEIVSFDSFHNPCVKDLDFFNDRIIENDPSITDIHAKFVIFIDEKTDEEMIEKAYADLNDDEQLFYWERYLGYPLIGKKGFSFCGCDVGEGRCSSITDCDYIVEPQFTHHFKKLNQYGIFGNLQDAIDFSNDLKECYPNDDEIINGDIRAIWRRIK